MPVELPQWIDNLRRSEVVERVRNDPRSINGTFLGVTRNLVVDGVIGGGQAEFDEPWNDLSGDDRALLYPTSTSSGTWKSLPKRFACCSLTPRVRIIQSSSTSDAARSLAGSPLLPRSGVTPISTTSAWTVHGQCANLVRRWRWPQPILTRRHRLTGTGRLTSARFLGNARQAFVRCSSSSRTFLQARPWIPEGSLTNWRGCSRDSGAARSRSSTPIPHGLKPTVATRSSVQG